jgi:dTMP kinase
MARAAAAGVALAEERAALAAAEEAAEDSATAAVRLTRAREKVEREAKERVSGLEKALESARAEVEALREQAGALEAAHARDVESLLAKVLGKDVELATLRADAKAAADDRVDSAAEVSELRRSAEEEARRREAEGRARDEERIRSVKEREEEVKRAVKEREEEFKKALREKDEELKRAVAAGKEAGSAERVAAATAELSKKLEAAQVR